MKRIVISLILISFMRCNAMNHFLECKGKRVSTSSTSDIIQLVLFEEAAKLENLLEKPVAKKSLDMQRQDGKTVLHLAAVPLCTEKNRVQLRLRMIKALMNTDIDKDLQDNNGKTAAQCLQEVGDFEGKQELLEALK